MKCRILFLLLSLFTLWSCSSPETYSKTNGNSGNYDKMSYEKLDDIEKNTHTNFWLDGLTCFAIASFVISLGISWKTFRKQSETEAHTRNVSKSVQDGKLNDMLRHLYRNLVCTTSMLLKYRHESNRDGEYYKTYPSEANMLKLQVLPDDFIFNIDVANDKVFRLMHEQKLLLRNYNLEIEVANKHFSRKDITEESIINDIDNILYKPLFLIDKIFDLRFAMKAMDGNKTYTKDKYLVDVVCIFVEAHFNNLKFTNLKTNEQCERCKEIIKENKFDCYISCGDRNGIARACDEKLFKQPKEEIKQPKEIISWTEEHSKDKKDIKCYINKSEFVEYFKKQIEINYKEESHLKEIQEKIQIITSKDVNEFYDKCKIREEFKDCLKEYFDFWNSNDKCEAKAFIYNILKIDAILEMPIIGMIQHEDRRS